MKPPKQIHRFRAISIIHRNVLLISILTLTSLFVYSSPGFVQFESLTNDFPLVANGIATPIIMDVNDYEGVVRAVEDLQLDIERVTVIKPVLLLNENSDARNVVIIGTLGKSKLIDDLVSKDKLDLSTIEGKWEAHYITTLENVNPDIDKALVIVGSDKRGTIFGVYELCSQIGVSPWYWWADVPVKQHKEVYISPGSYSDNPKVKYRGIFLNDEAPALTSWVNEKFGGFNHKFYDHLFELILRLKGNFLWPAMWGSAFYDDDSLSPKLADEYGVVIGTSHHEPLMRAHAEWNKYGEGPWNYEKNPEILYEFWRESVKERGKYEAVITVGMRGDGDEAMTEGTAINLLENIISDQREILKQEIGEDLTQIPQAWALYKEVQDYYDEGMQVPEDITLLLCDDNWGNVRRLPLPNTPKRSGGYGMYYHYDFVGGPVSYRWLNVSPISRTWEQMHLAWEHGVDQIWIANVGDLKPMEFPIDFFLEYAWDPDDFPAERLPQYTKIWAGEQFGAEKAEDIARLLTAYTRFNYRRTPEMLKPNTYSLHHFREAERIVEEYNALLTEAKEIETYLALEYKDAFYQLVTHPIEACANLNEMYLAVAKNHLYAEQGRAATNEMARKVEELFANDAAISAHYNNELADGKWSHFMDQPNIGYTSWDNPKEDIIPEIKEIIVPGKAKMAVAVEGSDEWWPKSEEEAILPAFDVNSPDNHYLEIFNRGTSHFSYTIKADKPWIILVNEVGTISQEERIWIRVNWGDVPKGEHSGTITISTDNQKDVIVKVLANNRQLPIADFKGFIEANGYVSIEAEHFTNKTEKKEMHWEIIPDFGRTLSGVTAFPTTQSKLALEKGSPHLEYNVNLFTTGKVKVKVYVAPSLNIYNDEGMQFATSFDDADPKIYKIHEFDTIPDWKYPAYWNNSVTDNIRVLTTEHEIEKAGLHILKLWMITPGVAFEKIVIETEEIGETYLGPPESLRKE